MGQRIISLSMGGASVLAAQQKQGVIGPMPPPPGGAALAQARPRACMPALGASHLSTCKTRGLLQEHCPPRTQ